jgi:hypothetical protein
MDEKDVNIINHWRNENQKYNDILLIAVKNACCQKY